MRGQTMKVQVKYEESAKNPEKQRENPKKREAVPRKSTAFAARVDHPPFSVFGPEGYKFPFERFWDSYSFVVYLLIAINFVTISKMKGSPGL